MSHEVYISVMKSLTFSDWDKSTGSPSLSRDYSCQAFGKDQLNNSTYLRLITIFLLFPHRTRRMKSMLKYVSAGSV